MSKIPLAAAFAAAVLAAPPAPAQSHSVTNEANPPQASSASTAATDATPGLSATSEDHDCYHLGKSARDALANRRRPAGKRPQQVPESDISLASAGNVAKETMQRDPSKSDVGDIERHAFDVAARH